MSQTVRVTDIEVGDVIGTGETVTDIVYVYGHRGKAVSINGSVPLPVDATVNVTRNEES